jgi:hypothetical protein
MTIGDPPNWQGLLVDAFETPAGGHALNHPWAGGITYVSHDYLRDIGLLDEEEDPPEPDIFDMIAEVHRIEAERGKK